LLGLNRQRMRWKYPLCWEQVMEEQRSFCMLGGCDTIFGLSVEVPPPCCILRADDLGVVVVVVVVFWLLSDFVGLPIASNTIYCVLNPCCWSFGSIHWPGTSLGLPYSLSVHEECFRSFWISCVVVYYNARLATKQHVYLHTTTQQAQTGTTDSFQYCALYTNSRAIPPRIWYYCRVGSSSLIKKVRE
jgi:hypothetical protein